MGRKKLEWYPGAVYHITVRSNHRGYIFKEEIVFEFYIKCMEEALRYLYCSSWHLSNSPDFYTSKDPVPLETYPLKALYPRQSLSYKGFYHMHAYIHVVSTI